MKKVCLILIALFITSSLIPADKTLNELNRDLITSYNIVFGAEDLFSEKISPERMNRWITLENDITQYVNNHDKDIFGTQDPTLATGLETIKKNNQALINAINATYATKDDTSSLIKMAATFKTIEKQMNDTMETLKNSSFILKRKKNARSLLTTFALFIAIIAKNATESSRIVRISPSTIQKFFSSSSNTPTPPSNAQETNTSPNS